VEAPETPGTAPAPASAKPFLHAVSWLSRVKSLVVAVRFAAQ